jgi:hypothetical protein
MSVLPFLSQPSAMLPQKRRISAAAGSAPIGSSPATSAAASPVNRQLGESVAGRESGTGSVEGSTLSGGVVRMDHLARDVGEESRTIPDEGWI